MIDPLTRAKNDETYTFPNEWRYMLFGTLLITEKLYRAHHNQWYLIECRRQKKFPGFINHLVKDCVPNSQSQYHYNLATLKWKKSILNLKIKESFRLKSGLEKQLQQRMDNIRNSETRTRSQHKLISDSLDYIELYSGQIEAVLLRDKRSKLEKKIANLISYAVPETPKQNPTPRVTVLGNLSLPHETLQLLDKGPKYALPNLPTSNSEEQRILNEVEVGLERYAYGARWTDFYLGDRENGVTSRAAFMKKPEEHKQQPSLCSPP